MSGNRCGHFALEVEVLRLPVTGMPLRVPVRRCALAESMVGMLSRSEAGRTAAEKLTIAYTRDALRSEEKESQQNIRVAFGPDLEAIHSEGCTSARCQESCTPNFHLLLKEFGFITEDEDMPKTSCLELTHSAEDSDVA